VSRLPLSINWSFDTNSQRSQNIGKDVIKMSTENCKLPRYWEITISPFSLLPGISPSLLFSARSNSWSESKVVNHYDFQEYSQKYCYGLGNCTFDIGSIKVKMVSAENLGSSLLKSVMASAILPERLFAHGFKVNSSWLHISCQWGYFYPGLGRPTDSNWQCFQPCCPWSYVSI